MLKLCFRALMLLWGIFIALFFAGRLLPTAPVLIYVMAGESNSDFYAYDLRSHLRINLSNSPYPLWRGTWSETGLFAYTANASLREADGLYLSQDYAPAQRFSSLRGSLIFAAQLDPRGKYLLYFTSEPANYSEIFLLDLASEERINISQTPHASETKPQWFGADDILFLRDGNLYQSDLQGNSRLFMDSLLPIETYAPSPDLSYIAFHALSNEVFLAKNGAITSIPLAQTPSPDALTWSPDSQAFAFSLSDGSLGIYHLASQRISYYPSSENRSQPLWSPDGNYIAFMQARRIHLLAWQTGEIFLLDEEGRIRPPLLWMPTRKNPDD